MMSEDIKIYHVETQEDYDDLMIKLENEGCMWASGDKPTSKNYWYIREKETVIFLGSWGKREMTRGDILEAKSQYPTIPIIKHKAKGAKQMEKVVVPQFVADWYEANKKFTMYGLLKGFEVGVKNEQLVHWIEGIGKGEAQRVIAKMHLFQDYEVEGEKDYHWRKKEDCFLELETGAFTYLNYGYMTESLFFGNSIQNENYKTKFTEREVKQLVSEEDFNKLERVEIDE